MRTNRTSGQTKPSAVLPNIAKWSFKRALIKKCVFLHQWCAFARRSAATPP
jgi:hypothetical protein